MTELKHYDFKHYIKKRRYLIAGCSAVLLQLALGATSVQAASTNSAAVTVQEPAAQDSKEETGQKQPAGDAVKKDKEAPAAAEGESKTAKAQQEAKPADKTAQDQRSDKDDKQKQMQTTSLRQLQMIRSLPLMTNRRALPTPNSLQLLLKKTSLTNSRRKI